MYSRLLVAHNMYTIVYLVKDDVEIMLFTFLVMYVKIQTYAGNAQKIVK